MRLHIAGLLLTLAAPAVVRAQASDTAGDLAGRTSLLLGVGLTGTNTASVASAGASARAGGEVGSISLTHWAQPDVAVGVSASVVRASASTDSRGSRTGAITSLLFDVAYSPRALALSPSLRPFLSAGAGPYWQSAATATLTDLSSTVEAAPGARFAAGVNWLAARHLLLSVDGAYQLVGHFHGTDATTAGVSGFGMTAGIGVSWGGVRR